VKSEPAVKETDRVRFHNTLEPARWIAAAPDPDRAEFCRLPPNRAPRLVVTPLLLTLNVAIYFVMLATSGLSFDTDTMLRWGALAGPLVATGEWWRLLTAAFVHSGFWPFALTMSLLLLFAPLVERMVGRVLFLACYFMIAVVGSGVSLLIDPTYDAVGAYGAVCGIGGMWLSMSVRARRLSAREIV
jgi:membrane associated rhomboid family serine protease